MLASFRDLTDNITLHQNLLHSSRSRHPTLGGGNLTDTETIVDFRNNLVFNWKGPTNFGDCKINAINNYYKPGRSTKLETKPMQVKAPDADEATGFVSGNLFPWSQAWTDDNFLAIDYTNTGKYGSTTREQFELPAELVHGADKPRTHSAEEAYDLVLQYAGASKSRDSTDARIVRGVRDGSNRLIDSQNEVGGWPVLTTLPAPADSDRDGMPDNWEKQNRLNPNDPADRNWDRNGDGYTNLEEYLNSIYTNFL